MRIRRCLGVVLLLALIASTAAAHPIAIAPGVTVEALRDLAGPWEIRVIRIERDEPGIRLLAALGQGELRGRETLSGIIKRESAPGARVVAGVNADFFRMSGPVTGGVSGPCVRDGELVTTPRGRPGFYVTSDGLPRIETVQTNGGIRIAERSWPMDGMNMPDQGGEGAVQIYTAIGGWEIADGCVVAVLEQGPLQTTGRWEATITEVIAPGTARAALPGEILISARDEQVRADLLQAGTGERVEIALETPPFSEPVLQAVGGSHVLVRGGEVVREDRVRHPRTAAGYNDREIVLVTVDGRQRGWSVGMTMTELAHLMRRLGCLEAVNLDGGGSTTAWAQHLILNRPSDSSQRPVANALLVVWDAPQ
ncbi:MAG: phosphodiester glycosidase family protein [Armatimonadota bacterium]